MKKAVFTTLILSAQLLSAQDVLYLNNANGTYQTIDTREVKEITFNEQQEIVNIVFPGNGAQLITSCFSTRGVESIAPTKDSNVELTYNPAPAVSFNAADKNSYNEVIDNIIDDESNDESGDFVENYTTSRIITITFSENGVKTSTLPTSGITATIDGGHIVINSTLSKTGYQITGTCSNGSLKIYSDKKFRLLFNNVNLTNPNGPAINIQSGKTVYASIVNGSTNTICDGATYNAPVVDSNGKEEDQKGTFFSEGQLIFDGYTNGTGTLNVTSYGGHAICSDDYIRVRGGNINILSAAKDGFRTKEKFIIGRTGTYSPKITINATSNGIECTEGAFIMNAGMLEINSGGEGIKVVYDEPTPDPAVTPNATISGGYISITTTGEKSSAIQTTGNYTQNGGIIEATVNGNGSKIINSDGTVSFLKESENQTTGKLTAFVNGTLASDTTSAGGIKCNGAFNIVDGTIAIACNGSGAKAINCDSDITIDGGTVTLLSTAENYTDIADDKKSRAITAYGITINGGIVVAKAYDHAIAATDGTTINGGIVNAYSETSTALDYDATQTGGWLLTIDAK